MPRACFSKTLPESFFEAIEENDAAIVSRYLSLGVDLNAKRGYGSDYGTPLTAVVAAGNFSTTLSFVIHGACVNSPGNVWGVAPMHIATRAGNLKIVKLLLDSYANVNVKDRGGSTPLIIACENGDLEMAKCLLENGAVVNHQTGFETVPSKIRKFLNENEDLTVDQRDEILDPYKQNTALTKAVKSGNIEVIKLLLAHDCDVTACTANGNTVFHIAAREGRLDILHLLRKYTKCIEQRNIRGETSLFLGVKYFFRSPCRESHLQTIKDMVCSGFDVSTKDNKGETLISTILKSDFTNGTKHDENLRLTLLSFILAATRVLSPNELPCSLEISNHFSHYFGDPVAWLIARAKSPTSLQHQCRLQIWQAKWSNPLFDIDKLPITIVMKNFLNLQYKG